jgi:hypothetical protein
MTRRITHINIEALRIRGLAMPLHNYVPVIAFVEKMISSFLLVIRPLGVSSWVDSVNKAEIHAQNIKLLSPEISDEEVGYCRFLLAPAARSG